jgi:hypothetical protein
MLKVKNILLGSFIILLQSGCIGGTPDIVTPPSTVNTTPVPPKVCRDEQGVVIDCNAPTPVVVDPALVGIGLAKGAIERYNIQPRGYYYYGQVLIEPKLTMHALSGPEAQTFLSHVSRLFQEKRKNFGLSVTPIIDGHRFPDIVLFTYAYDSSTQTWTTTFNEEPRTAMTLLKADTTLSFELKYTSIDGRTFNQIKELTKSIYGGTMLLSGTSLPVIDLIADKVSGILSHAQSSSTTLYFSPILDHKKSVNYHISTNDGKELATVKFSLLLRDSVITGAVVDSQINTIPQVDNLTNPLNLVQTHINDTLTLNDRLQREASIATFFQIQDPSQFRNKCREILDKLETYGLNMFDRYNAFSQILEGTDFLQNRKLYESGCLTQSKLNILRKMGIPFNPPPSPIQPRVEIGDELLKNFGRYMLNPIANVGFKSDLLKLFSDTVIVNGTELMDFNSLNEENEAAMSPKDFMSQLGKIGVARYGGYSHQRKDFRYFLFRPLNSETIYRIKLSRAKSWGRIRNVNIEPWADEKIAKTKQKELRRAAESTVLGYKEDILRKENQVEIALN